MLKSILGVLLAVSLLVLGVATTAQAEPQMYTGSITLQEFGNDTTTGTTYPFNAYIFLGIPHGLFCNPYASPPGTDGPCYGASTPAQTGAPLTGGGQVTVTGVQPRAFTLGASQMSRVLGTFPSTPGGSFSYYPPYIYSYEFADLRNVAGFFGPAAGVGSFTYNYTSGGSTYAQAKVSGGSGFGGTMNLLGFYKTISASSVVNPGSLALQTQTWLQHVVGHAPTKPAAFPNTGQSIYSTSSTWPAYFTLLATTVTQTVVGQGFGWTTGTATVSIVGRGPFPTILQRKGYDNRKKGGTGTIQLVSPLLHHWFSQGGAPNDTGGIGIMNLQFAPEPDKSLMLAAGLGLLGVLWIVSRRSH